MPKVIKVMKKKEVLKYCSALIINIIPFFSCCLLCEGGIAIIMMFSIFQILINLLNYKWTNKVIS